MNELLLDTGMFDSSQLCVQPHYSRTWRNQGLQIISPLFGNNLITITVPYRDKKTPEIGHNPLLNFSWTTFNQNQVKGRMNSTKFKDKIIYKSVFSYQEQCLILTQQISQLEIMRRFRFGEQLASLLQDHDDDSFWCDNLSPLELLNGHAMWEVYMLQPRVIW